MKNVLTITILFFGLSAKATPINLTCTTNPLTTSLAIFTTGIDVTVRVINHNGVDFIPISQTTVTPHDLIRLSQKAKILQKLGAQYDIHIDSSRCSLSQKLINCYGPIDQTINGEKISYFTLDTSTLTTKSVLSPTQDVQTVAHFSMTIDGADYDFAMNYDTKNCVNTAD
jgi:hypothetical protein